MNEKKNYLIARKTRQVIEYCHMGKVFSLGCAGNLCFSNWVCNNPKTGEFSTNASSNW